MHHWRALCLVSYVIFYFARFRMSAGLKLFDFGIFRGKKKVFDLTAWYWTVCLPLPWLPVPFDLRHARHAEWFLYLVLYMGSLGSVRNLGKHGFWGPQQEILAIKHWYSWYRDFILPDFKNLSSSKCGKFGKKLIQKKNQLRFSGLFWLL